MLTFFKARRTDASARTAMRSVSQMSPAARADIGMVYRGPQSDVSSFDLQWALARSTGG